MKDPYTILGVAKTASAADIKSAFRKLAKKHHPDSNKNDPKAQERFGELSRAYEIIGDPDKRAKFDRGEIDADGREANGGAYPGGNPYAGFDGFDTARSRGAYSGGSMDAEDILNTMFGSAFRGARTSQSAGYEDLFGDPHPGRRQRSAPPKGKDINVTLPLSVEQVIQGGKTPLSLSDGRTVKVTLPSYIEDGQVVRLKGQGEAGPAGHRGDVLARIVIKPGDHERICGRTLIRDVDVPLATAINGGKVTVSTPDGRIALKVAPWSDSGQTMRIKERGLPMKNGKRADMLARLSITLEGADKDALQAFFAARAKP